MRHIPIQKRWEQYSAATGIVWASKISFSSTWPHIYIHFFLVRLKILECVVSSVQLVVQFDPSILMLCPEINVWNCKFPT